MSFRNGCSAVKFSSCKIAGAYLIETEPFTDERGHFARFWCANEFADHALTFKPLQANLAVSRRKGTIRGMHYQTEQAPEAKLVRCSRGAVFDVVVDLRRGSPTYLAWFGEELSAQNGRMMLVPEGCAHGCLSLQDDSEISYLASALYAPDAARGIRFDDPAIGVEWPVEPLIVSGQDRAWPLLQSSD